MKLIILDRDGVININHGYVHTPANTDWVPGIFQLVADAQARGHAFDFADSARDLPGESCHRTAAAVVEHQDLGHGPSSSFGERLVSAMSPP